MVKSKPLQRFCWGKATIQMGQRAATLLRKKREDAQKGGFETERA